VWIGVAPNLFIDKTRGSLDAVVNRIERARVALAVGPAPTVAELEESR
jgi:hypothetical protein